MGRCNRKCQEKRKTCQTARTQKIKYNRKWILSRWGELSYVQRCKLKLSCLHVTNKMKVIAKKHDDIWKFKFCWSLWTVGYFYSANGNSELCKTFLTQIMFYFSCSKDKSDSAGPSVDILSQSEQEVARILGPEIFTGIPGGQDTMKLSNTSNWILSVLKKPH